MMAHFSPGARSWIVLFVLIFSAGGLIAAAETVTLTFRDADGEVAYKLSFDPSRISEEEVKAVAFLDPRVSGEESISPNLERCHNPDPRYFCCGSGDLHYPHFFENALANLKIAANRLARLDSVSYPKELEPVVQHERKSLSFSRWLEQTRYDFYQTWDTEVLKRKYDGLDPSVHCASEIAEIERTGSNDERFKLAQNEWRSCVLSASFKLFGSYPGGGYPRDAWKRFLEAYGIKEELVESVN
jgi:hypothetical protein